MLVSGCLERGEQVKDNGKYMPTFPVLIDGGIGLSFMRKYEEKKKGKIVTRRCFVGL